MSTVYQVTSVFWVVTLVGRVLSDSAAAAVFFSEVSAILTRGKCRILDIKTSFREVDREHVPRVWSKRK